nr:MAG TPA: hypothetical protein [Bacteriophage sp.]
MRCILASMANHPSRLTYTNGPALRSGHSRVRE